MPQDEVETLEAALNFISQYEMASDAATVEANSALNLTHAFEHQYKLNKTHSLEISERTHTFNHSHSLEIPEDDDVAMETEPFDPDLHAAEAFIDDFKVENELFETQGEMQQLLNMSTTPQSATIASPSSHPRRRHRVSKKEEISELRDTVAELSKQLDQLLASSTPNSPAEEDMHVGSILSQPESLWQQVAARQLLLRHKAEEVNANLRDLVETRVRQTKNLKRMLSRRNDAETLELIGLKRRKQMYVTGLPPKDNEEVYAKLLAGTDELYVGLDKLYVEKGMPQVPCPGRKRQVQRDAVNGAIVVFLDKNLVPFDLEKTQKAVWKLLAGRHRKDSPYTQGKIDWESQQNGNTVTNYVSFTCVAGNVSALLQVREVARKYVTDDRATFICRSVMEPTPSGQNGAMGLKFNETMTIVVRRGEPLSSGQETSIIESYLCATRHDEDTAMARKFRGEMYVDIAIEGWERSYSSNNQDIENLLFDDAIQIDEKEVLNFRDDFEQSSEDGVSLNKFTVEGPLIGKSAKLSPCSSQGDVESLVESAPWPEVPAQSTKRRRRGTPRKEEIAELRKLATKLTKKLEGMKATAAKVEEAKKNTTENAVDKKLWKDIASRQLALRREADAQSLKLRDEVVFQAKYAANLKRMLKRRYSEEMLEMMPIFKRGRSLVSKTCGDNERVFKELLEGTDHIYSSVDALFAKKDMVKLPCPGRTRQAYPETVNGMFLELMNKTQVPFNSQLTASAVWKALNGRRYRRSQDVYAGHNILRKSSGAT